MVKPLLEQLRAKVEAASGLPATTKSELLKLVAELEKQSTRTGPTGSTATPHGVDRLVASVQGLEASHPEITDIVNRIATLLGNMGI